MGAFPEHPERYWQDADDESPLPMTFNTHEAALAHVHGEYGSGREAAHVVARWRVTCPMLDDMNFVHQGDGGVPGQDVYEAEVDHPSWGRLVVRRTVPPREFDGQVRGLGRLEVTCARLQAPEPAVLHLRYYEVEVRLPYVTPASVWKRVKARRGWPRPTSITYPALITPDVQAYQCSMFPDTYVEVDGNMPLLSWRPKAHDHPEFGVVCGRWEMAAQFGFGEDDPSGTYAVGSVFRKDVPLVGRDTLVAGVSPHGPQLVPDGHDNGLQAARMAFGEGWYGSWYSG